MAKESRPRGADLTTELHQLLDMAVNHREICPPLAAIAFKVGEKDIGNRLVRMSREGGAVVESSFVLSQAARREGRFDDAVDAAVSAVNSTKEILGNAEPDDLRRLLHLVRHAFAVVLFDLDDKEKGRALADAFCEQVPALEEHLGGDHFFRALYAQCLWYSDKDQSEKQWELATASGAESAWNARGTWYKDAERDDGKAEKAYREGIAASPESSLLLHNLAQILVTRAEAAKNDPGQARKLLNQADDLLGRALRGDAHRLRRHIHSTRDRLFALRRSLPEKRNGAKRGKGGGKRGQSPKSSHDKFLREGKASLGEALMAKLQEQQKKK